MSIPALDQFFINPETAALKKNWLFVVDKGPSEAPGSDIVRMLLVRLVKFLKLDSAIHVSYKAYCSKDNIAERQQYAEENRMLSRHGPLSSKEISPPPFAPISGWKF